MSLINKNITVDFDVSGTVADAKKAIANGIYMIIKDIYTDSSVEEDTVYLDENKQYSMQILENNTTNHYIGIKFNNQNNYLSWTYKVTSLLSETIKTITYSISKEKTIIALGIGSKKLDLAIGYQEDVGYFFLKIGDLGNSNLSTHTAILLKNIMIEKVQTVVGANVSNNRWTSPSSSINKTFINLPLFVQSGVFKELFELEGCYEEEYINYNNIIYSNGKYYKLLTLNSIESSVSYPKGKANTTILAIEIADD